MGMVVMVFVDRQPGCRAMPEQALVLGIGRDCTGCSLAADMTIQADDLVSGCHDDVQIMGDEQDAAAGFIPNGRDQFIRWNSPPDRSRTWLFAR